MRGLTYLASSTLLAAALAGCGGNDAGGASGAPPPVGITPTPTPAPSPMPPPISTAAFFPLRDEQLTLPAISATGTGGVFDVSRNAVGYDRGSLTLQDPAAAFPGSNPGFPLGLRGQYRQLDSTGASLFALSNYTRSVFNVGDSRLPLRFASFAFLRAFTNSNRAAISFGQETPGGFRPQVMLHYSLIIRSDRIAQGISSQEVTDGIGALDLSPDGTLAMHAEFSGPTANPNGNYYLTVPLATGETRYLGAFREGVRVAVAFYGPNAEEVAAVFCVPDASSGGSPVCLAASGVR